MQNLVKNEVVKFRVEKSLLSAVDKVIAANAECGRKTERTKSGFIRAAMWEKIEREQQALGL